MTEHVWRRDRRRHALSDAWTTTYNRMQMGKRLKVSAATQKILDDAFFAVVAVWEPIHQARKERRQR
jgi:hypothetical protein